MDKFAKKYEELQSDKDVEQQKPRESHQLSDYRSNATESSPLQENGAEEEGPHLSNDIWTWVPAVLAEFIGTMLFVAVGCASVSLGGGAAAMAHGIAITIVVACFGKISGGHFNPAISLGVTLSGGLGCGLFLLYVIAQILGAMTGASITRGFMAPAAYEEINGGAHMLGDGVSPAAGILCELAITWILVQSVLLTAVDPRSKTLLAPLIIGVSVAGGILAGFGTSGGSMNPARSLGAAVPTGGEISSSSSERIWQHHYVYWVGPILGSLLATVFYRLIFAAPNKRIFGKEE